MDGMLRENRTWSAYNKIENLFGQVISTQRRRKCIKDNVKAKKVFLFMSLIHLIIEVRKQLHMNVVKVKGNQ